MSMQWWKTKHGPNTQQPGGSSGFAMSSQMSPDPLRPPAATSYSRTSPQELSANEPTAPAPPPALMPSVLPEATTQSLGLVPKQQEAQPPAAPARPPAAAPAQPVAAAPVVAPARPAANSPMAPPRAVPPAPAPAARGGGPVLRDAGPSVPSGPSTFSPSKQFAIQVEEFAHDPELEEASIRFANGDDDGAEAGLLEVLAPHGSRVNHDETWLTLFDLYRATGRQEKFESAAIDFASRFGRSAPQWFSMPEIVGRMQSAAPAPAPGQAVADWNSPAIFGTQTLAALNAAIGKATPPYRLNWAKLNSIVESALEPLIKTFTQWAGSNIQLRFLGAEALEKVLKDATPSGDRSISAGWWKLRMEVLRVMHRPDEFELVALDYCVTYEVSPPSWESARCEYKSLQADGSPVARSTIIGEAYRDSVMSSVMTYGDSQLPTMSSQLSSVATVELSGQVLGDGKEALELLDAKLADADIMIISCARLMRIDFTAAGTLLNWVTAREGEGRQVQFVDVHRLVAAFFNVIGISEHARITIRNE
jgi:ABC-type transporter Mla MlaB component